MWSGLDSGPLLATLDAVTYLPPAEVYRYSVFAAFFVFLYTLSSGN